MSLLRSSMGAVPGSARVRASISGSLPMQESSELDRASSSAWGPWINRRTGTPVGAGSGVGAAVGVVVTMRVGGLVGTGFRVGGGCSVAAGARVGARVLSWTVAAPVQAARCQDCQDSPQGQFRRRWHHTFLISGRRWFLWLNVPVCWLVVSIRRSNCGECLRSGSL